MPAAEAPPPRFRELRALNLVLGLLVLLAAGRIHDHVPVLAAFRPALSLVALSMLLIVLAPRSVRVANLWEAWPARMIGLFAAIAVGSALTGLSVGASGSFLLSVMMPVMVMFTFLVISFRRVLDLKWIVVCFVTSATTLTYVTFFVSDTFHYDGYSRVAGFGMYDANDLTVLYMAALPLAVCLARSRERALRVLGWVAMVAIPASIALTGSRGGFIGLVVGGLATLAVSPGLSAARKIGVVAVGTVAFAVFAPDGYWRQMSTILSVEEDYNFTDDTGRIQIWKRGLGYVLEYPVLGVGPDNFVRAGWELSQAGRSGLLGSGLRDQAPHNTFLQVWAELGTAGLAVWLGILMAGVFGSWNLRRRLQRAGLNRDVEGDGRFLWLMCSYIPASFVGFAVTTIFVTHAFTPIVYVLLAIVAGVHLLAGSALRHEQRIVGQR